MQFLQDVYNNPPLVRPATPNSSNGGCGSSDGGSNSSEEERIAPRWSPKRERQVLQIKVVPAGEDDVDAEESESCSGNTSLLKKKASLFQRDDAATVKKEQPPGSPASSPSSSSPSSWDLPTLIEERRWPELRRFVRRRDAAQRVSAVFASIRKPIQRRISQTQPGAATSTTDDIEAKNDNANSANDGIDADDGNALHLLCSYRPPRDVVSLLCRKFPAYALTEVDSMGRTPLHVAVDYGASAEAVSALLEEGRCVGVRSAAARYGALQGHSSATATAIPVTRRRDALGKTPLMHACENATDDLRSKGVIKALVSADPYSVLEEDCCERTALEHAINAGAPDKVVKALQGTMIRAARDVNQRERAERSGGEMMPPDPKKEWLERAAASSELQGNHYPTPPSTSPTSAPSSSEDGAPIVPSVSPLMSSCPAFLQSALPSSSNKESTPRRSQMARRGGSTAPILAAAIAAGAYDANKRRSSPRSQGWERPAAASSA